MLAARHKKSFMALVSPSPALAGPDEGPFEAKSLLTYPRIVLCSRTFRGTLFLWEVTILARLQEIFLQLWRFELPGVLSIAADLQKLRHQTKVRAGWGILGIHQILLASHDNWSQVHSSNRCHDELLKIQGQQGEGERESDVLSLVEVRQCVISYTKLSWWLSISTKASVTSSIRETPNVMVWYVHLTPRIRKLRGTWRIRKWWKTR